MRIMLGSALYIRAVITGASWGGLCCGGRLAASELPLTCFSFPHSSVFVEPLPPRVPGTVRGAGDTEANKTEGNPCPQGASILARETVQKVSN